MPKLIFTLTDELENALRAEAERRNTTLSALVREYIVNGLSQTGVQVSKRVQWGGWRKPKKTASEGQEDSKE